MSIDASAGDGSRSGSAQPATMRRPRRLTLAAVWLSISGVTGAVYGGIIPFLPPIVTTPSPDASMALGLAAIAAAVGVWRLASWGRLLGIATLLFGILQAVAYDVWRMRAGGGAGDGTAGPITIDAGLLASVALDIVSWSLTLAVLWVLLQRWPSDNKSG